jgi:aldose 1-epimerase
MSSPAADFDVVRIRNAHGLELDIWPRGAVIHALRVPGRNGQFDDVVLGYDDAPSYINDRFYMGAAIGRYANRIARGRFTLHGRPYQLPINDPPNHLHGGPRGWHTVNWVPRVQGQSVLLAQRSPDGSEGYPGNLDVDVSYTLNDDNELVVAWRAVTDQATPLNVTQHAYFNLRGAGQGTIHDHHLAIHADHYLPVDETTVPTGERRAVAGTAFDFTSSRPVLDGRMDAYDHCYALRAQDGQIAQAAELYEPASGRVLTVLTSEPGMQLYTGQFLQPIAGKDGQHYLPFGGICLETQHFPDSPNQPSFPSTILEPGREFRSTTIFRFGIR